MSWCSLKLDVRASVRMFARPRLQVAALPCVFERHLLRQDAGCNYRKKTNTTVVVLPSESLRSSSSMTPLTQVTHNASLPAHLGAVKSVPSDRPGSI